MRDACAVCAQLRNRNLTAPGEIRNPPVKRVRQSEAMEFYQSIEDNVREGFRDRCDRKKRRRRIPNAGSIIGHAIGILEHDARAFGN
jgi:hypothetical protein